MGYSKIEEHNVYGEFFNYGRFGPVDIPRKLYSENKGILKEAKYTKEWLENRFDKEFPDIKFTISTLKNIPFNKIVMLAKAFGINYISSSRRASVREKFWLRKSIISHLTN